MRNTIRNVVLLSLLPLIVSGPAFARARAVHKPESIVYSSTVVDAVSGHPVIGAEVTNGTATATTDDKGAFSTQVQSGVKTTLTVSRIGYENAKVTRVAEAGKPAVPIKLQPKPTVTVQTKNGLVVHMDFDGTAFFYTQPLLTQGSNPKGRFCEDGKELVIDRSEIFRILGPAVRSSGGSCCKLDVLWFDIELKNGEQHHVSMVFDCYTYNIFIGGRDHDTFQPVYFSFEDIQEVDFP